MPDLGHRTPMPLLLLAGVSLATLVIVGSQWLAP